MHSCPCFQTSKGMLLYRNGRTSWSAGKLSSANHHHQCHHYKDVLYRSISFHQVGDKQLTSSINWRDAKVQRQFADFIAEQLHIDHIDDWYAVHSRTFDHYCENFLEISGNKIVRRLLAIVYPHTEWHAWQFGDTPKDFWLNLDNQRSFFEWCALRSNIVNLGDWSKAPRTEIAKYGSMLLSNYNGSLDRALKYVYPEYSETWQPWQLANLQAKYWKDRAHRRRYFDWLAEELRISLPSDWFGVIKTDIGDHCGSGILHYYGRSGILDILQDVFPHTTWQPWIFGASTPEGFFLDMNNLANYVEWVGQQLSIAYTYQWYRVTRQAVATATKGLHELAYLPKTLKSVYSRDEWHPWKFEELDEEWWEDLETQREYMDWFAENMDISLTIHWYKVQENDFASRYGRPLLTFYENSCMRLLMSLFPDTSWQPWIFHHVTPDHWKSVEHQREYMQWLAQLLNIVHPDDWYQLTKHTLVKKNGGGLLQHHNNSTVELLRTVFPEQEWHPWRFEQVPAYFWDDLENQHDFFCWASRCLNIKNLSDWYKVKPTQITDLGGRGLLDWYGGWLKDALTQLYFETEWYPWLFGIPQEYWSSLDNQKQYLNWLADKYDIKGPEDWYQVKSHHKPKAGYDLLSINNGSMTQVLKTAYPEEQWQPWIFNEEPEGYWENSENRRAYFDWHAEKLDVKTPKDWYKVKHTDMLKWKGQELVSKYFDNSLVKAMRSVYPEYEWKEWIFNQEPEGYWKDFKNHRKYFDWLAEYLEHREVHDWAKFNRVESSQIAGGRLVINHYNGHVHRAIMKVYPHTNLPLWQIDFVPRHLWNDAEYQRTFLDWFADLGNMIHMDEWYRVKKYEVVQRGGGGLLEYYDGSLSLALSEVYTFYRWEHFQFEEQPPGYWNCMQRQREYFDFQAELLSITHLDDWYSQSLLAKLKHRASNLLETQYEGMISQALLCAYPDTEWLPWIFQDTYQGFWDIRENHWLFFKWMEDRMGITHLESWYEVMKGDIVDAGGGELLNRYYRGSLAEALQEVYPHEQWLPWRFVNLPFAYFDDLKTQKIFMNWLAEELNIAVKDDWYSLQAADLNKRGGNGLLVHYENSPRKALEGVYFHTEWEPWKFPVVPSQFWEDKENQRWYMDWLAVELNVLSNEDWCQTLLGDVSPKTGASSLLSLYNNSMVSALQGVYSDIQWHPWLFNPIPRGLWDRANTRKDYVKWLEKKFDIEYPEEWHGVTSDMVNSFHGAVLINSIEGGLFALLQECYPNHQWDKAKWSRVQIGSKTQAYLYKMLRQLLPTNTEMVYDTALQFLRYPDTNMMLKLDLWIPRFNMAIELQGGQHYEATGYFGDIMYRVSRDKLKDRICRDHGILLINIPYWWNYREKSLAGTLYKYCPQAVDDLHMVGIPIPECRAVMVPKEISPISMSLQ